MLLDPAGMMSGYLDNGPYSPIRDSLDRVDHVQILFLASFDDLYAIESNFIARSETSEFLVENDYNDVLVAASLGDSSFNNFLLREGVTHVIIPLSSANRGSIRHKWGSIGSINLALASPYFQRIVTTTGDFPVVLFKVLNEIEEPISHDTGYSINWNPTFRDEIQISPGRQEKGMYSYTYSYTYKDGIDVSWVFEYPFVPHEQVSFTISDYRKAKQKFEVSITFLAAYGANALDQVVRVDTPQSRHMAKIRAGQPATINIIVEANEKVRIDNVLPCRFPSAWEPADKDWRKFCYGIGDVTVRSIP